MKNRDMREIEKRIEKIIDNNCIEWPWEGTEVHKGDIKNGVMELIIELMDEEDEKERCETEI